MGGTFDPPHKAHIKMAEAALSEFSLDKIMFMCGGNPPHKITGTDAKIRNHMLKLAIDGRSDFEIFDYEITKEGYSYTSDTLRYLNNEYPEDTFYFIIGGDSLKMMFTWHEPEEILKRCVVLVYPREGYPSEADVEEFNSLHHSDVRILHGVTVDVSSTEIREAVMNGECKEEHLHPEVASYIKRNKLYEDKNFIWEKRLEEMLKESRYIHSLGVAGVAVSMAGVYGVDVKKAYIAGLLHDCAKNLSEEETKIKCIDLEVELDEVEKRNFGLVHAKVGAELVKTEFGVNDPEICNAIRWHTLGREKMSALEKIIFVADMIEPNRVYPEVEYLRECAYKGLDFALLECVSAVIGFNEEKGKEVHPNAYRLKKELENG